MPNMWFLAAVSYYFCVQIRSTQEFLLGDLLLPLHHRLWFTTRFRSISYIGHNVVGLNGKMLQNWTRL